MIRFVKTPDPDNQFDHLKVEISSESDIDLPEAIDMADAFLHALGYCYDGKLTIRTQEEDEEESRLYRKIAELEDKLERLKLACSDAVNTEVSNDACCTKGGCCE